MGVGYCDLKFLKACQRTLKTKNLLIPWLVVKLLGSIGQGKINLRTHILSQHRKAFPTRLRGSLLIATLVIHEHQEIGIRCEGVLWFCSGCRFAITEIRRNHGIRWEGYKGGLGKDRTSQTKSNHVGRRQRTSKRSCVVLNVQAGILRNEIALGKTRIVGRQIHLLTVRCQLGKSAFIRSTRLDFQQRIVRGRQRKGRIGWIVSLDRKTRTIQSSISECKGQVRLGVGVLRPITKRSIHDNLPLFFIHFGGLLGDACVGMRSFRDSLKTSRITECVSRALLLGSRHRPLLGFILKGHSRIKIKILSSDLIRLL